VSDAVVPGRRRRRRLWAGAGVAALAAGALGAVGLPGSAAGAPPAVLTGLARTGRAPLPASRVVLYAAGRGAPVRLGAGWTSATGAFQIRYVRPRGLGILYVTATGTSRAAGPAVQLLGVAGTVQRPLRAVTVNELTTVGFAYALDQFAAGARISGKSPGLENAAATGNNLVNPATGGFDAVVAHAPNGSRTTTQATLSELADILAGCTGGTVATCARLFAAARPPSGGAPRTTLQAVLDIARNPVHNASRIFALPKTDDYTPRLKDAPTAWVVSLIYTAGGFNGPGRMAFDSRGNVWSTNNFAPPIGTAAGLGLISLSPTGTPINGSPVGGGGLEGVWWGIAIDQHNRIWTSNYVGGDTTPFTQPGFIGGDTVSVFNDAGVPLSATGYTNGAIRASQGIAVDQQGDIWIANHVGNSVTEYPHGDPAEAKVYTAATLQLPFAIVVDGRGNKWIDDNAISSSAPGGVTRIDAHGRVYAAIRGGGLSSPQGMAVDQHGNLWVANLGSDSVTEIAPNGAIVPRSPLRAKSLIGPWSTAVDGNGNVWVASFIGETLTELCGVERSHCPPGVRTGQVISPVSRGFTNGGLQHLTAVQIDESGNVWVANNWRRIVPTVGGNGLVEFVGLAAPVRTPLIGPPERP